MPTIQTSPDGTVVIGGSATVDAEQVVDDGLTAMLGAQPEGTIIASDGVSGWTDAGSVAGAAKALLGITAGAAVGTGTYASRPVTPSVGDVYHVTSGARLGSIYRCYTAGTWVLEMIDWDLVCGFRPMLAYDAEDLLSSVGGTVTRWRDRGPSGRGDLGLLESAVGTIAGLAGGSSWGSLACAEWNDAGTSPRLRSPVPGPLSTSLRSFVVVASSVLTAQWQSAGGWGAGTTQYQSYNLLARGNGGTDVTGMELLSGGSNGTGATPTGATPVVLLATYDGAAYALYQAEITGGTPSWTTSISPTTLALVTGARDVDGGITLGGYTARAVGSYPLRGRIHGAAVFPWVLSSGERDSLVNGLYARWA